MDTMIAELEKISHFPSEIQNTLEELQKARDVMITIHMPIVINMAFKTARDFHIKLSVQDLVDAGRIGLENALNCFLPHIHGKFSTHCLWYVKTCMEDVCKIAELEYIEKQAIVN